MTFQQVKNIKFYGDLSFVIVDILADNIRLIILTERGGRL